MEFCPCGITPTFQMLAIFEQPTDSDPYDYQVTSRVKFLKALLGPHSPVLQEYVGLKGFYERPYLRERLKAHVDLYARGIGTGEVPSSFSPVLAKPHAVWTAIYNAQRPAEGEYVNLYDIRWENPEGHVIRKGEKLYYGFFTQTPGDTFTGTIQLRGLDARHYHVTDYVAGRALKDVSGPTADLPAKFQDSLLLVAEPSEP
jgi:alpha-galactosidase